MCLIQKTTIIFKRCLFSPRWTHFEAILYELRFGVFFWNKLFLSIKCAAFSPFSSRCLRSNHRRRELQDTAETNLNNRFDDFSKHERFQRNFFQRILIYFHIHRLEYLLCALKRMTKCKKKYVE